MKLAKLSWITSSTQKPYPVIATTSELMTTGVDAKTCKLVVLDQNIQSMTKFKQIIGRGTRIDERYGKLWFTILDFKKPPNCLPMSVSMAFPKSYGYHTRGYRRSRI